MLSKLTQKRLLSMIQPGLTSVKTPGDLNLMLSVMQARPLSSATFFTLNKPFVSHTNTGLFSAVRAYSTQTASDSSASSSSESESEMEADQAPQRSTMQNRIGGLDAEEALTNLEGNLDKVLSMEEQSLSVYIGMVSRGMVVHQQMARERRPVIGEFCKRLDQRLKEDLEKKEIPNILHEVGNLITVLNRQRMSNVIRDLNRSFGNACQAAFQVTED